LPVLRILLILSLLLACLTSSATPCADSVGKIGSVDFIGNDKTKEHVLLRELTFNLGDSVALISLDSLLESNRKLLFNLRLFNSVRYSYTCEDGNVAVIYNVQERYYLYPIPIFDIADRNINSWLDNKDYSRLDYGILLIQKNFRGRNEELRLRLQHGFNRKLEFIYRNPALIPSLKLGVDLGISDYRSRIISYNVIRHRQVFYEQERGVPIHRASVFGSVYYRENVQRQTSLRLSYLTENISDAVAELNPAYFGNGGTNRKAIHIGIGRVVNLRSNFVYPLTGSYFDLGIGQVLFLEDTGSDYTAIRSKFTRYMKLSDKFYYAVGAEAQARFANRYAFTDNVALGFRSQVRGYELYVIGGQHFGIFKQGISREILNVKDIKLPYIKNPKLGLIPLALYLNVFTDAGYTIDNHFNKLNLLTNRWLFGTGVGLHVITFYDIVGRVEYTINREGNRGLFFSTGIPF
jgi:outer membrane protein assembly factor BamA